MKHYRTLTGLAALGSLLYGAQSFAASHGGMPPLDEDSEHPKSANVKTGEALGEAAKDLEHVYKRNILEPVKDIKKGFKAGKKRAKERNKEKA